MAEYLLLDDFIDFQLVGVNSSFESSFQFIYHLNQQFETRFQRINDLDILINQQEFFFSTFYWYDVFNKIDYHIIKNRPTESISKNKGVNLSQLFPADFPLVSEYDECNYILKITGWDEDVTDLKLPFKTTNFIDKLKIYDIEDIRDADRLIF
ncbi:IPExxxVDY family protein [Faecalibacter rhinopitheci]|uniref:IPExxxVDY family protein n=1 Tax=Faecalibacter rhinopitheci TaxID=2779678 RepID=A0A8J7K4R1_9FLAO|nr:IPExxxVDY family protein [Faecalibacter rhinopitheci]MBF0597728.1 IPExxxVDY family protein [Faecalibacter rhinopitheci]MBQ0148775.1 IPExxxVDY family protein [Candidatus Onthonaster equi]